MKITLITVIALFAYAQSAISTQNDITSIQRHWGYQELRLNVPSAISTLNEDDQLLSRELAELDGTNRSLVANAIQDLLESFRNVVVNGNDDLPVLDPLNIPQIGPFLYTDVGIRAEGIINNFHLDGLRWYVVDEVSFNALLLSLGVKVTVPWLTFTGSYDVNAFVALFSHSAGGNYRVFVNRLEVSVDTRLGTNIFGGGHLVLRELDIDIVIHDINIQIDGLVGSSLVNNLINSMLQNAAQNLLRDELANVSQMLSEELYDVINDFLKQFTLSDLLG